MNTNNYKKAGVLEVGSAHLLSGLNNIEYHYITSSYFTKYFGFTEENFKKFVEDKEIKIKKDEF